MDFFEFTDDLDLLGDILDDTNIVSEDTVDKFNSVFTNASRFVDGLLTGTGNKPATFFAPGRVNLIGEHIDYNGGLVMPISINLGIKGTFTRRDDLNIYLSSTSHEKRIGFGGDRIPPYATDNGWCNYPIGVIDGLKELVEKIGGFNLHFESNLPEGSGLSSSAAIEVLTAYALLSQTQRGINLPKLASFCQKIENEFIGVKCGIMDQFAVANSKKDHALLLDCDSLAHEYIPFEIDDYALLVINSNKPRSLIHSAYNDRKEESEEALRQLIAHDKLLLHQKLVAASMDDLWVISDAVILRRARHVVSEQLRVKLAAQSLRYGDLHTFGRLMSASHQSMKEDYEVTGREMDILAETAQNIDGCLGARMTGGGFGGCAIALVRKTQIDKFTEILSTRYHMLSGLNCSIYTCHATDRVHIMT